MIPGRRPHSDRRDEPRWVTRSSGSQPNAAARLLKRRHGLLDKTMQDLAGRTQVVDQPRTLPGGQRLVVLQVGCRRGEARGGDDDALDRIRLQFVLVAFPYLGEAVLQLA